jgi:hypothetical protein
MMAFAGNGWNDNIFDLKYDIAITGNYAQSMFQWFCVGNGVVDLSEVCKKLDFSGATNITSLFQNAKAKNITLDLSSCTNASNAFNCNSGGSVDYITLKVTENLTNAGSMFLYNTSLTNLTFTDDSVLAVGLTLQRCHNLTKESIVSVINALSTTTTGKEVKFSLTAVNKVFETSSGAADGSSSAEWQALKDTKSNWTISAITV